LLQDNDNSLIVESNSGGIQGVKTEVAANEDKFLVPSSFTGAGAFWMKYDLFGEYALEEKEEVITIIVNTNTVSGKYSNIVRMDGFKK
jgi:hypothetical protein